MPQLHTLATGNVVKLARYGALRRAGVAVGFLARSACQAKILEALRYVEEKHV